MEYDWIIILLIIVIGYIVFILYFKASLYRSSFFGGNNDDIIIHISGPSGSGKTTLGKRLKENFNISMKDMDDLRDEFAKEHCTTNNWKCIDENEYQKYIDKFIQDQPKPLVLVGLTDNPRGFKEHYYNVQPTHKYYINIDDSVVNTQKCRRFIHNTLNDDNAMKNLKYDNSIFLSNFVNGTLLDCNILNTAHLSRTWGEYYKKQNYKFMNQDEIYDNVSKILDKYKKI